MKENHFGAHLNNLAVSAYKNWKTIKYLKIIG